MDESSSAFTTSEKRFDDETSYQPESVYPTTNSDRERSSTPDISEFLHANEFKEKINLKKNEFTDPSTRTLGETSLISRRTSISEESDDEKLHWPESVCPTTPNERSSTPDISEFLHPDEFKKKMNLNKNELKHSSRRILGETSLISHSVSVSADTPVNSCFPAYPKTSNSLAEGSDEEKIYQPESVCPTATSNGRTSSGDNSEFLHPVEFSVNLQRYGNKNSSRKTSGETPLIHRKSSNAAYTSANSSSLQRYSKTSSSSDAKTLTSNDDASLGSVIHYMELPEETAKEINVLNKETSNMGESSSSSNSVTVSRNRLVTPNMQTYSGDWSSHTKSSTTPTASTSFKVVAVVEGRGAARGEIGMAYIDLKNPLLVLSQFADTQAYIRLAVQLNILQPIEIILPHTVMESRSKIISRIKEMFPDITTATVMRKHFNEAKGLQYIQNLCVPEYKTVEVEAASKYYSLAACSALIKYMEFKQNVSYISHSLKIVYRTSADTTMISTSTARHLELVTNELGNTEHTLYGILNHTQTPGGDRLLRANILQPPSDNNTIVTRLDCIAELMDNEDLFNDLKSVIGKFMDTEHMLSLCIQVHKEKNVRNSEQKITNIIALKHALDLVKPLSGFLADAKNALFKTYYQALSDERFEKIQEKIGLVIHNDIRYQKGMLNMHMQKCFAVKSNINGLLDIARRAYSESVNDVMDIVQQLEKQYNLPLKVEYNSLKGFYIQIQGKAVQQIEKLPSIFLKVNKFKSIITCTTEDLIKLNDRIKESLNEIYIMSDIITDELLNEVRENIACLYYLTEAVSSIDFLLSLTHACTLSDHVRPEFSGIYAVKGGRHPIIERVIGTTFIPNDTFLCEEMNFIVLSGANMSGKTTYLKQVAVLQVMAQIGCYVPAEFASFRIVEKILTLMGCGSDIEKNYSTFMLQMKEANFILQHATENSIIMMDELGKGTNLEEGCGLAYAISEELLRTKAFCIFSTHFMEITELASVYPNVENYHFRVDYNLNEDEGCVCNFPHLIIPGPCKEKYYGTQIAELSTLPRSVIKEAEKIIQNRTDDKQTENNSDLIDDEMKRKIKIAIHLIHLSKNIALDENELRDHLRLLKAECSRVVPSEDSQSTSTN